MLLQCFRTDEQPYDNRVMGNVIRKLRIKQGLSQEVLSGLSGVARSHLAMIESGKKKPSVDTLWKIAGGLGLKLSDLFRMVEKEME